MRLSYFALAFLPLALASPFDLEARADASAAVLKALKSEDTLGKSVNSSISAIDSQAGPTSAQLSDLSGKTDKLNTAIKKATAAASKSSAFSSTGSKNIATYVQGTLAPDTISILDNLESKYPGFKAKKEQSLIKATLSNQLGLVKKQAAALQAKLAEPYASQAPAVAKQITDKYNEAIKLYSK